MLYYYMIRRTIILVTRTQINEEFKPHSFIIRCMTNYHATINQTC